MTDLKTLLQGKRDCPCGREHTCPIEKVVIGEDAYGGLGEFASTYRKILLVADSNTYAVCGSPVAEALGERLGDTLIFLRQGILVPDERAIRELSERVTAETDLLVGVGSGVINDLCKHVSFLHGIPYAIVATAPSMDGYASKGAALILDGMKVTLNAHVPKGIFACGEVLRQAPMEMIRAGYGDIIGKYSCLCDWKLSHLVNREYLCSYVMDATYETVERTVLLADGIVKRDNVAVCALMEALVTVGILMAYVGNSRPASGSEHHLSHFFEIVGISKGEPYLPHGVDVCCSAVETAKIRETLAAMEHPGVDSLCQKSIPTEQLRRVYGGLAEEVLALQKRVGFYDVDRLQTYRARWQEIRAILADSPSAEEMLRLTEAVGLSYAAFRTLYGEEKLGDALLYAKDLKDRYTVLWMYYDLLG